MNCGVVLEDLMDFLLLITPGFRGRHDDIKIISSIKESSTQGAVDAMVFSRWTLRLSLENF